MPGYVTAHDRLLAKGVDEIWCLSVNDAFVMGAWGRDQKAGGKVRMMADGSATYTKALGLEMDLTARGMGMRSQRYSMLVDNGVVKAHPRRAARQVRGQRRRDDAPRPLLRRPIRPAAPAAAGGDPAAQAAARSARPPAGGVDDRR